MLRLPSPGAEQCGNHTASAPPSLCPQTMSLFVLQVPSLPPSSLCRFPAVPYSRQCHPLPALLGDRGALAGRALPVALAKGKKGRDPRQEGAVGPQEVLGVRGSTGYSTRCWSVLGTHHRRAGMERAPQGVRAPQGIRALLLPTGPPLPGPCPPARTWMEKTRNSPPKVAQPAPHPLPGFYPIATPSCPGARGAPAPTERGLDGVTAVLAKVPLGSGCKPSIGVSKSRI